MTRNESRMCAHSLEFRRGSLASYRIHNSAAELESSCLEGNTAHVDSKVRTPLLPSPAVLEWTPDIKRKRASPMNTHSGRLWSAQDKPAGQINDFFGELTHYWSTECQVGLCGGASWGQSQSNSDSSSGSATRWICCLERCFHL